MTQWRALVILVVMLFAVAVSPSSRYNIMFSCNTDACAIFDPLSG
jgi:hypothetical protein